MHTTCPECSSVFRVNAEQLKMAEGQVRCGFCQAVFNALNSLEEGYNDTSEQQKEVRELQGTEAETDQENQEDTVLVSEENPPEFDQTTEATDSMPKVYQDDEAFPIDEIISTSEEGNDQEQHDRLENEAINNALDEMLDLGEISTAEANDTTVIEVDEEEFESILDEDGEFVFDDDLDDEPSALAQLSSENEEQNRPSSTPMSEIQLQTEQLFREVEGNIKKSLQQSEQQELFTPVAETAEDEADEVEDISDDIVLESATEQDNTVDSDAPSILRDELAQIHGTQTQKKNLVWAIGIIVLCLSLATQMLYHFRNDLAKDEPMRSVITSMCNILPCEVPLRNDARNGIKTMTMFSHSIESIDDQPEQLRVQAIFTNTANYTQAYPVLSLRLADENNRTMAMRRFMPEEYLAKHINIKQGLPAKTAIEVIIDLVKPETTIVSYHFDFL